MVRLLSQQTEGISKAMLDALLQRLRGPIQLPECLRVVGYLRRLAPFPETVTAARYHLHDPSLTGSVIRLAQPCSVRS